MASTQFMNVDLDIYSELQLQPLVDRLGRKVLVLYAGRERGRYSAHLELARYTKTPDATIRAFCRLIRDLPAPERMLWNTASVRSFNIGIQAGTQPNSCEFTIRPSTIRGVSEVGSQIVLTIYSPEAAPAGDRSDG